MTDENEKQPPVTPTIMGFLNEQGIVQEWKDEGRWPGTKKPPEPEADEDE